LRIFKPAICNPKFAITRALYGARLETSYRQMTKNELVAKIIQNENSAFTESDEPELLALSEDVLKRLCLSAIQKPVQNTALPNTQHVENVAQADSPKVQQLKEALVAIQANIRDTLNKEAATITELAKLGIKTKAVQNAATLTDADITSFVQTAQTPLAQVLREAVEERNKNRQALIDRIVTNSDGLFAANELLSKTTDELHKLATLSVKQNAAQPQNIANTAAVFNWQGAGINDLQVVNAADVEPLVAPGTWDYIAG
jgi:hypothetical protein